MKLCALLWLGVGLGLAQGTVGTEEPRRSLRSAVDLATTTTTTSTTEEVPAKDIQERLETKKDLAAAGEETRILSFLPDLDGATTGTSQAGSNETDDALSVEQLTPEERAESIQPGVPVPLTIRPTDQLFFKYDDLQPGASLQCETTAPKWHEHDVELKMYDLTGRLVCFARAFGSNEVCRLDTTTEFNSTIIIEVWPYIPRNIRSGGSASANATAADGPVIDDVTLTCYVGAPHATLAMDESVPLVLHAGDRYEFQLTTPQAEAPGVVQCQFSSQVPDSAVSMTLEYDNRVQGCSGRKSCHLSTFQQQQGSTLTASLNIHESYLPDYTVAGDAVTFQCTHTAVPVRDLQVGTPVALNDVQQGDTALFQFQTSSVDAPSNLVCSVHVLDDGDTNYLLSFGPAAANHTKVMSLSGNYWQYNQVNLEDAPVDYTYNNVDFSTNNISLIWPWSVPDTTFYVAVDVYDTNAANNLELLCDSVPMEQMSLNFFTPPFSFNNDFSAARIPLFLTNTSGSNTYVTYGKDYYLQDVAGMELDCEWVDPPQANEPIFMYLRQVQEDGSMVTDCIRSGGRPCNNRVMRETTKYLYVSAMVLPHDLPQIDPDRQLSIVCNAVGIAVEGVVSVEKKAATSRSDSDGIFD